MISRVSLSTAEASVGVAACGAVPTCCTMTLTRTGAATVVNNAANTLRQQSADIAASFPLRRNESDPFHDRAASRRQLAVPPRSSQLEDSKPEDFPRGHSGDSGTPGSFWI